MGKFCAKCGTQLNDGVAFCPKCGQPTQGAVSHNNPSPVNQPPINQPPVNQPPIMNKPVIPPQHAGNMNNGYAPPHITTTNNSSNNSGLYIILAVIAIAVVAVGAYFILFNSGDGSSKPANSKTQTVQETDINKSQPANKPADVKKTEASHNTGVITGTEVRMRANPGTNSNIIGYFDRGEKVEILNVQSDWIQVKRSNGAVGWVSAKFCSY
ncbi:SH3 domain-containing protein [uncultured Anaerovibrio sp.]|uniref:SH3 domain-containing protein n=1 Tax=uncultured Anaerovibrio sp. TaxID=361586 RepID=UPI0025E79544|nr:SH3 domain-containing protein [uncultured Anaerovibrio sp.]